MKIIREECTAVIVDIQERLHPHIFEHEKVTENTGTLIRGLYELNVPILVTQQYTKGLGPTVPEIARALGSFSPIEKKAFSCCGEPDFLTALSETGKKTVLLAGIETHVCVLQTVLDLLSMKYLPVVVEDCVSSRKLSDKSRALSRFEQAGALITTYESLLFELLRTADDPAFKAISALVK